MNRISCTIAIVIITAGCDSGTMRGELTSAQGGSAANPAIIEPVVLHRLNNLEYNNSVRDLLGTSLTPAASFPADAVTNGFDNVAASLTLTPALISLYNQAAEALADDALDPKPLSSAQFNAVTYGNTSNGFAFSSSWSLTGSLNIPLAQAQNDTVAITITAGGSAVSAPTPAMAVSLDGQVLSTYQVTAPASGMTGLAVQAPIAKGNHTLTIAFTNYQAPDALTGTGNQLIVGTISVVSTTFVPSAGRALVYVCDPNNSQNIPACWQSNITTLAQRAWRRPLSVDEKESLLGIWQDASSAGANDAAFKMVIQTVLMSSKFLFRPSDAAVGSSGAAAPLDAYALASRLSYFLWASMPDTQLLSDAAQGLLSTDAGLRSEVSRMLADPKAVGLQTGFAAQWLSVRALVNAAPDPNVYPSWDANLIPAMTSEAQLVFADFLQNNRPLTGLLTPGFTYLNDRLAQHYGLPAPGSAVPVRVELPSNVRGGLLTQGAMLVTTSQTNRTSPVERGLWVLEQLLCTQLAPPPNVPPLPPVVSNSNQVITMRAQMAAHLTNPACSSCHNIIDPLGFGLEEFDGVGATRTMEAGQPVNATGQFPNSGPAFTNAYQMAQELQVMPQFSQCVANKMYSYALGRGVTANDTSILQSIDAQVGTEGTLDALITAIVLSPAFRLVNTTGAT